MRSTLLFLLGLAAASGQPISFSGPMEGFTFDAPTGSLRAVAGFPGSASFGPALMSGLDFGSVAPQQSFAIVFQAGNCAVVSNIGSNQISSVAITSIVGQPEAIEWSGDGSLAVLYSRAGNWIQAISGLPDNPTPASSLDVSSLGGSLSAVAVDAKGRRVAIAITGDQAGVYLMTDGQSFTSALPLANPIAVAFSNDAARLFALDTSAMQMTVLTLDSFDRQTVALDGLADPFAVRPAPDVQTSHKVYVASRSDQLLREYDISNQQVVTDLPLYFAPTGIQGFGHNSFLVASRLRPSDALWLLTSGPQPAVYFVPAIQPDAGGQQ